LLHGEIRDGQVVRVDAMADRSGLLVAAADRTASGVAAD
jgi:hypothetical protein